MRARPPVTWGRRAGLAAAEQEGGGSLWDDREEGAGVGSRGKRSHVWGGPPWPCGWASEMRKKNLPRLGQRPGDAARVTWPCAPDRAPPAPGGQTKKQEHSPDRCARRPPGSLLSPALRGLGESGGWLDLGGGVPTEFRIKVSKRPVERREFKDFCAAPSRQRSFPLFRTLLSALLPPP